VVRAAPDVVVDHGEDGLGRARDDEHVVHVLVRDLAVDLRPRLAAVGAVPDAVYLEPDPHVAVVGGIDGDSRRAGDADVRAVRGDVDGELLPGLACIRGPIDARLAGRARPCKHHARIDGIDGDAPNHRPSHRRVEQAPLPARVVALVEAHVRARVDHAGPPRVREQRADNAVGVHALAHAGPRPALALVGAHHDALADRPYQDGSPVRHGPPPADVVRTLMSSQPFRLSAPRLYVRGSGLAMQHPRRPSPCYSLGPPRLPGGPMRAWTVDADDIRVAEDFDESLLHRTPEIDSFLTPDRDDKFIVIATKGFGKTLLLKAKRILYQRESRPGCLPSG